MLMDNLLCDEVWAMISPNNNNIVTVDDELADKNNNVVVVENYEKEDFEETFRILLEKEVNYMPERGYVNYVTFNSFIDNARYKSVHWVIRCQRRLNFSFGTAFDAINYLDRFISLAKCQEWKEWMFELLSVACLSVSTKFNETDPPSLHEIQMDGFENMFESNLIQRMELTVLEALGWRLSSTTSYSYVNLLTWNTNFKETLHEEQLTSYITELLLGALLDPRFLDFRPCIIAETALRCGLDEFLPLNNYCFNNFTTLIPQESKDDLQKCKMMMIEDKGLLIQKLRTCGSLYCPSSPVTVLTTKQCDHHHELLWDNIHFFINVPTLLNNINNHSIILGSSSSSTTLFKKRKREEDLQEYY